MLKEYTFLSKITQLGIWWKPGIDQYTTAELFFSMLDSVQLKGMNNYTIIREEWRCNFPILWGKLTDSTLITLIDNNAFIAHSNMDRLLDTFEMQSQYILVGGNLTMDEIQITKVYFNVSYLDLWLSQSGFKINSFINDIEEYRGTIEYKLPEDILLYKGSDYELKVTYKYNMPNFDVETTREARIRQRAYLQINYQTPADLTILRKDIGLWRDFISFAQNVPCRFQEVVLIPIDNLDILRVDKSLSLIFSEIGKFPEEEERYNYIASFYFNDVKQDILNIISKWKSNYSDFSTCFELYFDTMYNYNISIEVRFLRFIVAFESYHRKTRKAEAISKDKHKKIKKLLKSLDLKDDERKWLDDKTNSKEIHLHGRLIDALETVKKFPFNRRLNFAKFEVALIEIRDTRNYLAHYDRKSKHVAQTENKFRELVAIIKFLFQSLVLNDLGFDKSSDIEKILVRSNQRLLVDGGYLISPHSNL